jgi:tetratricopeptide (TPR) repeat protein
MYVKFRNTMRKSIVIISAAIALSCSATAQSMDEGIKMVMYERYESAKKILQPLAATNPTANYYLGLCELNLGNVEAAKNDFAKYPEDLANMSGMVRIYYAQNNAAQALQLAQTLAAKAKKKEWQPLKMAADGVTYSEGASYAQAIEWYKTSLQRNDNLETHIALGDAYQKIEGGGGEAMNNYEKVIEKDPKNSLAYSRIGALWYAARNYASALENYEKAKNADPSNPLPYRDLANAYYYTGKYELAKQNIEKYLDLSDKLPEDEVKYLYILYLAKYYQEADSKATELLGKGIAKPGFYGIKAFSAYELKQAEPALNNVRLYFGLQDPKKLYPDDYIKGGFIYLMNKLPDSADVYFNKGIESDTSKDKTENYRKIAEGFKALNNSAAFSKAAFWYCKIPATSPKPQALDYFWCGAMNYYSKSYGDAAKAFEDMETKFPDQPSATYWRGRVAAAVDSEAKEGTALPYYTKWLEKVGPTYDKKNDLKQAYQYIILYYYNKEDKDNLKKYMDILEAMEPTNAFLQQIKEAMAKPAPTTPKTPKTPKPPAKK